MWILAFWLAAIWSETPGRQPQLANDGAKTSLVYGAGNDIFVRNSEDAGKTWSEPMLLPGHGVMSLGMRRGPRVARQGNTVLVTAIQGEKGRGADGDVWLWRSEDAGRTWSGGERLNDVPGSAREGLHAMASGGGRTYVVWLDLRTPGMKLYGASSRDGGKTWGANELVYASPEKSICECCHPSLAVDAKGQAWVMFRNSINGRRDLYLKRWGTEGAQKLGTGEWVLNACPMDGGALALDPASGKVFTVWRREKMIYSAEAGAPEKELGEGKQPIVWRGKNGFRTAWMRGPALVSAEETLAAEGAYPSVAAFPDGTALLAFEAAGKITLRRLE